MKDKHYLRYRFLVDNIYNAIYTCSMIYFAGLRPFIHEKDVSSFDEFLRKKGIAVKDSVHGSTSSFLGHYE